MSTEFPHLFAPLRVGRAVLKNRIASTSHDAHFGVAGLPGERYIRYHVAKAEGGAALVQAFGATSVHPSSPGGAGNINNWDDRIVAPFQDLAERVHAHGALITCQLVHRGRRVSSLASRLPPLAPSDQPNERTGEIPHAMSRADIRMVIDAFAAAAERTCRAGFDGVEIAVFGDMLPDEFLSPAVNLRSDEYGGTFEKRLRFPVELLGALREAIGPDPLLFVRMSGDDFLSGELSLEERLSVARHFDSLGIVDAFSVTGGTVKTLWGRARHVPSSYFPHGVYRPLARAFRAAVRVPVLYAGRIVHPREAEDALAAGDADIIGMTRAIIADPQMPKKAETGRVFEIRLCVGANEGCIGRLYQGLPIECVQNPVIGREVELGYLDQSAAPRQVLVIGGGPAGLEAARVAAARGHRVVLLEREAQVGGQVVAASQAPGRQELADIVRWLAARATAEGVEIRLKMNATRESVLALQPDVVVVATGSRPRLPSAVIDPDAKIVSASDILLGVKRAGPRVVVIAEDPHMAGPTTADYLTAAGHDVVLITPFQTVGDAIDDTQKPVILERLLSGGARLVPYHAAVQIDANGVVAEHVLTGVQTTFPADTVVAACGGRADDTLYTALESTVPDVHLIGDAVAPRRIHDAILEGTRIARRI